MKPLIVTGFIGSGKSSVSRKIKELNPSLRLFNFDEYTKRLYAIDEIKSFLLSEFATTDRKKISQIVFSNKRKMELLNQKFLPYVNDMFYSTLQEFDIIEFPMYYPFSHEVDLTHVRDKYNVLFVSCSDEERLQRVMKRDSLTKEQAQRIIDEQIKTFDHDINQDDYVIMTDKEYDVEDQIEYLMEKLDV